MVESKGVKSIASSNLDDRKQQSSHRGRHRQLRDNEVAVTCHPALYRDILFGGLSDEDLQSKWRISEDALHESRMRSRILRGIGEMLYESHDAPLEE